MGGIDGVVSVVVRVVRVVWVVWVAWGKVGQGGLLVPVKHLVFSFATGSLAVFPIHSS